jgi:hypothetical protein
MVNAIVYDNEIDIHPESSPTVDDSDGSHIHVLRKALHLSHETPTGLPRVTSVSQKQLWDCGLACVQMAVRWITHIQQHSSSQPIETNLDLELAQQSWMMQFVQTQSIWTMDLFSLLHSIFDSNHVTKTRPSISSFPLGPNSNYSPLSVSLVLCSESLGVNESYRDFDYYREQLEEDAERVRRLFGIAQDQGWNIFQTTSTTPITKSRSSDSVYTLAGNNQTLYFDVSTLVYFISRPDCIAIALIDQSFWNLYNCIPSENQSSSSDLIHFHQYTQSYSSYYTGHYVLVSDVTFDSTCWETDRVHHCEFSDSKYPYRLIVHDPGGNGEETLKRSSRFVPVEWFEKCWRSNGTDSDVILISVRR